MALDVGLVTIAVAGCERGAAADPVTLQLTAVAEATVTPAAPSTGEDPR